MAGRIFKTRQFEVVQPWLVMIGLSSEAVLVYLGLLVWAQGQGVAFPTHAELGRMLNCSSSSLIRALRKLRDFGCIRVHPFFFGDGRQGPNDYEVYNDSDWPEAITPEARKMVDARRGVISGMPAISDRVGVSEMTPLPARGGKPITEDSDPSDRAASSSPPPGGQVGGEVEPNHAWECAERVLAQIADRVEGWTYTVGQIRRQLSADTPIPQLVAIYGEDVVVGLFCLAVTAWEKAPTWKAVLEQHNQLHDELTGTVRHEARPVRGRKAGPKENPIEKAARLGGTHV